MTVYAPGTQETDPKKQNRSLQANAAATATNATNITQNTTDIATANTNIATNTTNIATNTTNIAANAAALAALAPIASSGSASNLSTGTVPTARLGSGSATSSTFLRGDQAWVTITPMVLLNTLTPSGVASISDITSLTATYNEYEIVFENVLPVTATTSLELQVHQTGGGFISSAYLANCLAYTATGSAVTALTTFIPLSAATVGNTSNRGVSGRIRVYAPLANGNIHNWSGESSYLNASAVNTGCVFSGHWTTGIGIDGFQILFSSGNIASGTIKIYGRL